MLTSKEIIERTGISRATLNNYIGGGLVPRPQVLPPGPEHGAAPRIGYFPDDTVERIETIQRLKREGWSITRIADHFAGRATDGPARGPAASVVGTVASVASAPVSAAVSATNPVSAHFPSSRTTEAVPPAQAAEPRLSLAAAGHPAYLVNDGFRLVWANDEARVSALSPVSGSVAAADSVFPHLLQVEPARGRDALLRFHLQAARLRGASAAELFGALVQDALRLEVLYREVPRPVAQALVAQALLSATALLPERWLHAVHFREGVLFTVQALPGGERPELAEAAGPAAPTLTPLAVLAAVLQDAPGLWVRLAPEEYFELLNEIGRELDAIFRRQQGSPRRAGGETVVCHFLPSAAGNHLWNALAAASEAREAMRQVSQRWQLRKGWDFELQLNIGIDEGQDWLGTVGAGEAAELRVLGDAAERAGHLSRCARKGAILLTRNLVGKLPREQRQRLTYGAARLDATHGEAPLLFTFARLGDIAAPGTAWPAVADLAVAELLDLQVPLSPSVPHSGSR